MIKILCNFCRVKIIRGFAYTSGTDTNLPNRPPPQQQELRFQKQAFCLALRLRFCGFRLVLASSKGKSFLLLSELIPAFTLSVVAPCLLTMWGASKSFRCDYLFCQQLHASEKGGSLLIAITHPLFPGIISQQCRPSSGKSSAF